MKTRESGMPPEETWQHFFDAPMILDKLGLRRGHRCVVDFGCGYGTFAIPAAQIASGIVYALDIDPEMVAATAAKAKSLGIANIQPEQRDFAANGSGLDDRSVDYVMLFNILHAAEAELLLNEARRVLTAEGTLAVIHWNYDSRTPRGPAMEIRPTPEQCRRTVEQSGFDLGELIDLPPYHYGFIASVRGANTV